MKPSNRSRFRLEQLEDRLTPAVNISTANGILSITGTPVAGPLVISMPGNDLYNITENGVARNNPLFPLSAPNGLSVNLTGTVAGTDLTLTSTVAASISKSASINLGTTGDHTFTVDDTNGLTLEAAATPTTPYTFTYTGGSGSDTLFLGSIGPGPLDFHGNVNLNTGAGDDDILIGDGTYDGNIVAGEAAGNDDIIVGAELPVTVAGLLSVSGANSVDIINGSSVAGNVSISTDDAGSTNVISIDNTSSIGSSTANSHSITGSNANDIVTVSGTVNGNLTVSGGAATSANLFNQDDGTITGRLTYVGGANGDSVTVSAAVDGAASINMGDGTNIFTADATSTFGNTLQIYGGSGSDTAVINTGSMVAGSVTASLGNGDNTFDFEGTITGGAANAPAALNYTGGTGIDDVTFGATASATNAKLTMRLGDGDDTLHLDSNDFISAYFDGGAGSDTFDNTVGATNVTLVNFEM